MTSCITVSVNRHVLFFLVAILYNVSRQDSKQPTVQLFHGVKMANRTSRMYHVLYHASCFMSVMCTLFLKTEYTLSLSQIFITTITSCSTSLT
jgi:hypothetical protein